MTQKQEFGRERLMTVLTFLALFAGIALGLLFSGSHAAMWHTVVEGVSAVGTLYTNAVRLIVMPLLVSMLVVAVAARGSSGEIGRMLGLSLATFVGLLLAGVFFVLMVLPPMLGRLQVNRGPLAASAEGRTSAPTGLATMKETANRPRRWAAIANLLPANLIKAAENDDLLPLVIFAILLGLALTRLANEQCGPLISFLQASAETMRVLAGWILRLLPVGVFSVAFATTATFGWGTVGIIGYWIAIVCFLTACFIGALYVIASLAGGVRITDFARAVAEAQGTALATRSSVAALPALLRGAASHLRRPRVVAEIVLPLSVATFKLNRAISSTCRLLFLAYVYGISLSATVIVTFVATALLTSFATPGLPSSGAIETLPLYLAAGIPVEGVILLGSVDSIPDVFMTVLNVTGDMTALTIVGRLLNLKEQQRVSASS